MNHPPSFRARLPAGSGVLSVLFQAAALLAILHFGKPVLLPITLALLATMLLLPLSRALERVAVPRPLAAMILVGGLAAGTISLGVVLREPARSWLERAPESVAELRRELADLQGSVEQVVEAADQVEEMTQPDGSRSSAPVVADGPSLSSRLLGGTWRMVSLAGLVGVLVLFFLTFRSVLLAKLVALMPDWAARERALSAAATVRDRLGHFFLTKAAINTGLGVGVGLVLWRAGYGNPALWGVMAAILNIVPYLGSMTGVAIVAVVGLLSLDGVAPVLAASGGYALLTSIEGTLVTPAVLGRSLSIDPVVILVGVLVTGVVWGPAGILLTVPILVTSKVVAEHYPGGRILALLLGRGAPAVRILSRARTRRARAAEG